MYRPFETLNIMQQMSKDDCFGLTPSHKLVPRTREVPKPWYRRMFFFLEWTWYHCMFFFREWTHLKWILFALVCMLPCSYYIALCMCTNGLVTYGTVHSWFDQTWWPSKVDKWTQDMESEHDGNASMFVFLNTCTPTQEMFTQPLMFGVEAMFIVMWFSFK